MQQSLSFPLTFFSRLSKGSFFVLYVLLIAGSLLFVGSCARIFGCIDITACISQPNTQAKINDLEITITSADYSVAFDENNEADVSIPTSFSVPLPTKVTIKNIALPQGAIATDTSNAPVISGGEANIDSNGGDHRIVLTITAEDGESTREYTVNIEFINSESIINSLEITSSGTDYPVTFDQNFQATINIGTSLSNPLPTQVTIKSITLPQGATVTDGNNNPVASGSPVNIDSSSGNHRIVLTLTSQDGSSSRDYTVNIVFVNSDSELLALRLTVKNVEYNIVFDVNNQAVINDGSFSWMMPSQAAIQSLTLSQGATAMDANNNVALNGNMVDITLDGVNNVIALTVTAEDTITSSNYTITLENTITSVTFLGTGPSISAVDFNPDGTRVASASVWPNINVRIWDANTSSDTSTSIATIRGHVSNILSIDYNPDGTKIASGSDDNTIKISDATVTVDISTSIVTLSGHSNRIRTVAFSPDGSRLASGSDDNTIKIWDASKLDDTTPTAPLIATLSGHTSVVFSVAFSPDGSRLASGSWDDTIMIWDATTTADSNDSIVNLTEHSNHVRTVAFSPNGSRLASGHADNSIKIWDASKLDDTTPTVPLIATLSGHTSSVVSVAFYPDGSRLASGSVDQNIKIWDATVTTNTSTPIVTLSGHTNDVNSVAFSPDGSRLASGSLDGTIKIWR